ncbi:hypothetical protein CEP51_006866 [Fusarium floridanum]|uniref:Uncharacterized protein n=1 Tax=Fusarium floridanum TaxID=1325733 RepID=A0A428RR79_9HYPO|nr:hypothetical protein CEP51_006866 [Fusarium floridanum]
MIVLTVGTAAILFCVTLLIFLWEGARRARSGRPRTEFWDTIVFDNWTTQLVTICSAGIRVSMGFQIGLAAAAMAAVILETAGSRFCDTAMLSIQRASSSSAGPLDLLPTAWRHCLAGRVSGLLYFPILAFMVAIALVSTLTSTILLFDLEQGHISAPMATHLKAVGFDNSSMYPYSSIAYWKSRPLAHWRFAETRPGEMETELRTENAVDTGDVYRAMLPFDSATDRTTLEYYQGPAVVINQRTACFAPTFSNATVQWESGEGIAIPGLHLNATSIVENQTDFLGRRAVPSEPNFLTEVSSLTVRRNDTGVLRQLGVGISPDNTTGRGILDLQVHPGPDLWIDPDEEDRLQSAYLLLWVTLVEYSVIGGWSLAGGLMKNDITTMVTWSTHPEHAAVFQKILQQTGDPAQAVQALIFRIFQMLYYDWLPIFDPTHQVTTINTQEVLTPQKWTGFAVVMAIIAAHFAVTALTMVLFAKRTESSLLGNAWQAVSQMVSPETQDIIRAAGGEGMKDKEVEVLAKSAGRSREAYALSSGIHSGRTELRVRQI